MDQLRLIASDPDDQHVFILQSFLDAAGFVDLLSVTTCDGKHAHVFPHSLFSYSPLPPPPPPPC